MPLITKQTFEAEIIGAIFSPQGTADGANEADLHWEFPAQDVLVTFRLNDRQDREVFAEALVKAIQSGNIPAAFNNGTDTVPVIEAINMGAHHPSGERRSPTILLSV